jgi:hypothetical protein
LSEPTRKYCRDVTIRRVESGHWMAQEKPAEVNAHLVQWLVNRVPRVWA